MRGRARRPPGQRSRLGPNATPTARSPRLHGSPHSSCSGPQLSTLRSASARPARSTSLYANRRRLGFGPTSRRTRCTPGGAGPPRAVRAGSGKSAAMAALVVGSGLGPRPPSPRPVLTPTPRASAQSSRRGERAHGDSPRPVRDRKARLTVCAVGPQSSERSVLSLPLEVTLR